VARAPAEQRHRAALAARHLASTRHGLAAAHGDHLDVLLPLEPGHDAGRLAQLVAHELGAATSVPVTCGGAGPVDVGSAADVLPRAHAEATRCADTLLALDRVGDGADATELGFVGFVLADQQDVGQFVDAQIGALLQYDQRRRTELVATLGAYFRCGQSPARASQCLHIHVNTVTQRLDRISQLLGQGWQEPERALEIQVALRLHRLRT